MVVPPEDVVVVVPQCFLQPPELQPPEEPHVAIAGDAMASVLNAAKMVKVFFTVPVPWLANKITLVYRW
ncbi:hypothetical protein NT2_06_00540 [Caenibius tardaugens NBRC 16725]|uniref:Uncharacterized protein n=1 Tax=Caenibius tardaugens NBRC 16725 TaxID=1219035 RepID=U2YLQ9_9SPHN|nr:hypothetical protein NT2_06_00540 [Caenibius tardaugens NBRC 16725]